MADLVSQAQFLSAGVIQSNSGNFQIDDQVPLRLWDIMEELTRSGDNAGDRWTCEVLPGRTVDYGEVPETPSYRWSRGQLLGIDGTTVEPWMKKRVAGISKPAFSRVSRTPRAKSAGVVDVLKTPVSPVASSRYARSVKVPPISLATLIGDDIKAHSRIC